MVENRIDTDTKPSVVPFIFDDYICNIKTYYESMVDNTARLIIYHPSKGIIELVFALGSYDLDALDKWNRKKTKDVLPVLSLEDFGVGESSPILLEIKDL